jgi:hypothetical protein
MSDPIGSALSHAANTASAAWKTEQLAQQPNSVSTLRTRAQANQAIENALGSFGMGNGSLDKLRKAKIYSALKLQRAPGGPVSNQTRQFVDMLLRLRNNQHASGVQKQRFAAQWLGVRSGKGARPALEAVAQRPAFWKSLNDSQRSLVAARLGSAKDRASVTKLKDAITNVIGSKVFSVARSQSKNQALLQPARADRLLKRWKRLAVKMPLNDKTCRKEATEYVKRYSGYKTSKGQKGLRHDILVIRDRVLSRFFEDMPTYKVYAGKSKLYGDYFLDGHLKNSHWGQTAHDFFNRRRAEEKCGLFQGRGEECLK